MNIKSNSKIIYYEEMIRINATFQHGICFGDDKGCVTDKGYFVIRLDGSKNWLSEEEFNYEK